MSRESTEMLLTVFHHPDSIVVHSGDGEERPFCTSSSCCFSSPSALLHFSRDNSLQIRRLREYLWPALPLCCYSAGTRYLPAQPLSKQIKLTFLYPCVFACIPPATFRLLGVTTKDRWGWCSGCSYQPRARTNTLLMYSHTTLGLLDLD